MFYRCDWGVIGLGRISSRLLFSFPVFIDAYRKHFIPLPQNTLDVIVVSILFVPYLRHEFVKNCVLVVTNFEEVK